MPKILVLGGTGFVGRHVCEKLASADHSITVATRRLDAARAVLSLPRVVPVVADVHDPAQLASLVAGHDLVINLVAILHGSADAFEKAHVRLPAQLAQACAATGVRKLVHVSALGAAADAPSVYQRSKAAGEAALQKSGLDLHILRPSVIFGADDKFLNLFAKLQAVFPVMPLGGATTRFQPVWVEDVAEAVVRLGTGAAALPSVMEACGPDIWTLRELVELAGRLTGHPRPVVPLPNALARLQAAMLELAPGEPMMSRDNLDSMRVDNIASGQLPGLGALGIQPAALSAVAPQYLGHKGPRSRLTDLRKTAGR